jgi:hypothetical protein
MKKIILLSIAVLSITVAQGQFGLVYSSGMKTIIEKHKFINNSLIDSISVKQIDSSGLYFPFFYKLHGREVQQANYFGYLYLTDSLIIFNHKKRSNSVLPEIKPFLINISSIVEYELFEKNDGLTIKTNDDMEYFFLTNSRKGFYVEVKQAFEKAQLKKREAEPKKTKRKK